MTGPSSRSADIRAPRDSGALENYLQIDLGRLFYWLRSKVHWIGVSAVAGAVLAAAYVVVTPARYSVTSEIMVDPTGLQIVSDDLYGRTDQRDTQLLNVDTKLQTLLSRNVLMAVVEKLDLTNDPEFVSPPSTFSFSLGLGGGGGGTRIDPAVIALNALKERVSAMRDERSFIVTLTVRTRSAEKSVAVAQTIVDEFRSELIRGDAQGASRTAEALASRLAELKQGVNDAEEAVETFRRQNGLRVSNGELVSSRSMSQVDTQLREARERLISAQSRYDALSTASAGSAAIQSETLSALRTQYATLKQRSDAQGVALGPRHPRRQAAELELRTLETEINSEISRLTRAAQNEMEQARSVVAALEAEATEVSTDVFSENASEVRLRELTREAAARSVIYESFLARSRVASERQQLDSTNIRVISEPLMPTKRSWPPSLSQAAVFGGAAGFALGALAVLAFGVASDMRSSPVGAPAPAGSRPARRPATPANTQTPPIRPRERQVRMSAPGSLLSAAPRPATAAQATTYSVPHASRGPSDDVPPRPRNIRR